MVCATVGENKNDIEEFLSYWEIKTLKKKDHFLVAGEVCAVKGYVTSGCFRRYIVSENSKESIVDFATEDWWIADLESFLLATPTRFYIQALINSEVLCLTKSNSNLLGAK